MMDRSSSLPLSVDMLCWEQMIDAVQSATCPIDALETASEAKGYLRCLYDVGLLGAVDRNRMADELQHACTRRVLRDRYPMTSWQGFDMTARGSPRFTD